MIINVNMKYLPAESLLAAFFLQRKEKTNLNALKLWYNMCCNYRFCLRLNYLRNKKIARTTTATITTTAAAVAPAIIGTGIDEVGSGA